MLNDHRLRPCSVRDVVAHLIGGAEATASFKQQLRQQSKGLIHRDKQGLLATVNDRQPSERGNPSTARHAALEDAARRGVENRSRLPALVQRIELPLPAPVGWEYWGYLNSKAYTRDTWMHRIDISQATGRALEPSADHEGLIVADLVPDCSKGKIPGLMPTGQAGGIFGSGNGPSYDAIAFCQGHRRAGNLGGNHAGCIVVLDLLPSLKPWLKQLLPAVACPVRTRETSRLMMATTAGRMDV